MTCKRFSRLAVMALLIGSSCSNPDPGAGPPDNSNTNGTPPPPNPEPPQDNDNTQPPGDGNGEPQQGVWSEAFIASGTGVLSAIWGSSPDDVFAVGGKPAQGEVYHFDGTVWQGMRLPSVPLLVWVFGFGPDNVLAVGVGGGAVHYDGDTWTRLQTGTTQDLWGIWGPAPDDLWIVGGDVGSGGPLILHYDGRVFFPVAVPANDRRATSLFKVWGTDSRVVAVGENGLILESDGGAWQEISAGPEADDDFIALWGTAADNMVAVGGRSAARVAVRDGTGWRTQRPLGIPALNAVFMIDDHQAVVGGVNGFVGLFDLSSGELVAEDAQATLTVHAAWGDGAGRVYAVGGRFSEPFTGLALVRTADDPGIVAAPPLPPPPQCAVNADCASGLECVAGECVPAGCSGPDGDGDSWPDACDNCPAASNLVQADSDGDGAGDACDHCAGFDDGVDTDGDAVPDGCDGCPGSSDAIDGDGDGVADACDRCAGFPDSSDADGDGVPNGCDVCDGTDTTDSDQDGVPDACDRCAGGNDSADADGDGIANHCDRCAGFPDSAESDGDGVPNGCDRCPGFDDRVDVDGDGVPNGCDTCMSTDTADGDNDSVPDVCDRCMGYDDRVDADGDDVADNCDKCPGHDDRADADADAVADGCDKCPGFSDAADADGDGVPDGCDQCPTGDDAADADGDGNPDACDICPGFDDEADADGDGAPDGCDICPGFDDEVSEDGDDIPDGCDDWPACDDDIDRDSNGVPDGCCKSESDCPSPLGFACVDDLCVEVIELEIGVGGGSGCPVGNPYSAVVAGGQLPICEGFQGFSDLWLNFRVTGFAPGAMVNTEASIGLADSPCATSQQCGFFQDCVAGLCSLTGQVEQQNTLTDAGDGVNQLIGFYMIVLQSVDELDGEQAGLAVTLTQVSDPNITVSINLPVVLRARRLCFGPTCPAGQTCMNNYCQ